MAHNQFYIVLGVLVAMVWFGFVCGSSGGMLEESMYMHMYMYAEAKDDGCLPLSFSIFKESLYT